MITIAILGVAHIHTPYYVKTLKELPNVKVKYIWDHNKIRAEKCATELNTVTAKSLDEVVNDKEIEAVVVISETNLHKNIVLACAKAKKNLYVEKPLGVNGEESIAMAKAIDESGVIFNMGFGKRSPGFYQFIRQHIEKGSFGKITRIRASCVHGGGLRDKFDTEWRWMADPVQSGGGAFFDMGVHGLDLLLWLMGDAKEATGSIQTANNRYPGCDEFGEAIINFRNGVVGTLAAGWVDPKDPLDFTIWGTEGYAYLTRDDKIIFSCKSVNNGETITETTMPVASMPHPFVQFLENVEGKGSYELVTAQEAAYVNIVMSAIYRGAQDKIWQPVSSNISLSKV